MPEPRAQDGGTTPAEPAASTPPSIPSASTLLAPAEAALVPIAISAAVILGGAALVLTGVKLLATVALTMLMILLIMLGIWWLFSPRAWIRRAARRLGIPRLLTALAIGGLTGVALSLVIGGIAHGRYVSDREDRFHHAIDRDDWRGARAQLDEIEDAGRAWDAHTRLLAVYDAELSWHTKDETFRAARKAYDAGEYAEAASMWNEIGEFRNAPARAKDANEQAVMRSAVTKAERLVRVGRFGAAAEIVLDAERQVDAVADWSSPFVKRYAERVERRVGRLMKRGKYRAAGAAWAAARESIPESDALAEELVDIGDQLIAGDTRNTTRALMTARQQLKTQSFNDARRVVKRELPDALDQSRLRAMLTSIDAAESKWKARQARLEAQRRAESDRRAAEQAAAAAAAAAYDDTTDLSGNWCGASRDGDGDGVWCE
jgi:hypothetical protein